MACVLAVRAHSRIVSCVHVRVLSVLEILVP